MGDFGIGFLIGLSFRGAGRVGRWEEIIRRVRIHDKDGISIRQIDWKGLSTRSRRLPYQRASKRDRGEGKKAAQCSLKNSLGRIAFCFFFLSTFPALEDPIWPDLRRR